MTATFTATSGNRCTLTTITVGNRSGTNALWEDDPSDVDIDEVMKFHAQMLSDEVGADVMAVSIRESNPEKISKIIRSHIGGGNG